MERETQRRMERGITRVAEHRREQKEKDERISTWQHQQKMQAEFKAKQAQEEKKDQLGGLEELLDKKKKKEQEAKRLMELMRGIEEASLRMRNPTLQDHAPGSTSYERNRRIIEQAALVKERTQRDGEKKTRMDSHCPAAMRCRAALALMEAFAYCLPSLNLFNSHSTHALVCITYLQLIIPAS
jgi:hypothetical protein